MKPGPSKFHCRMPAEWEAHASTWLAWPHYRGDWPGKFEPIPWVYAEIVRQLARHEQVELIVNNAASEKRARKVLDKANALSDNLRFHLWPTNRVWTRDFGCTFAFTTGPGDAGDSPAQAKPRPADPSIDAAAGVAAHRAGRSSRDSGDRSRKHPIAGRDEDARRYGNLSGIKWRFNAWAKYPNYQHDEKIGSHMAKAADAHEIRPVYANSRVVLEGGSIDVNGCGTLLTTEECLLSKTQQRNTAMSRADYEKVFSDYLGIKNVIWLNSGIAGDDTHGHVDDITRFVAPDTVVTAMESDRKDPNYEPLRENLRRLRAATDQDGKPLAIIELPMPDPVIFAGRRLPASYANFYIANGVVLVPVFNDPNDRFALDILAHLFPDRGVIGIYSGDLIWGFGAMHCMTQQQPRV